MTVTIPQMSIPLLYMCVKWISGGTERTGDEATHRLSCLSRLRLPAIHAPHLPEPFLLLLLLGTSPNRLCIASCGPTDQLLLILLVLRIHRLVATRVAPLLPRRSRTPRERAARRVVAVDCARTVRASLLFLRRGGREIRLGKKVVVLCERFVALSASHPRGASEALRGEKWSKEGGRTCRNRSDRRVRGAQGPSCRSSKSQSSGQRRVFAPVEGREGAQGREATMHCRRGEGSGQLQQFEVAGDLVDNADGGWTDACADLNGEREPNKG